MMIQLEGPIVESLYDMSLLSWAKKSDKPLPLISGPFTPASDFKFGAENPSLKCVSWGRTDSHANPHGLLQTSQSHRLKVVLQDFGKHQRSWRTLQSPRRVSKSTPYIHPTNLFPWPWFVAILTGVCIPQSLPAAHWLSPPLAPGHSDVAVPQNVAWLAGFRLAQQSVFMCVRFD